MSDEIVIIHGSEDASDFAIVDVSGTVTNVTRWDEKEPWAPPEGTFAVKVTDETGPAAIGDTYSDGRFVRAEA